MFLRPVASREICCDSYLRKKIYHWHKTICLKQFDVRLAVVVTVDVGNNNILVVERRESICLNVTMQFT